MQEKESYEECISMYLFLILKILDDAYELIDPNSNNIGHNKLKKKKQDIKEIEILTDVVDKNCEIISEIIDSSSIQLLFIDFDISIVEFNPRSDEL